MNDFRHRCQTQSNRILLLSFFSLSFRLASHARTHRVLFGDGAEADDCAHDVFVFARVVLALENLEQRRQHVRQAALERVCERAAAAHTHTHTRARTHNAARPIGGLKGW
jgi:hypothetical protein